jgi:hypothetical protein
VGEGRVRRYGLKSCREGLTQINARFRPRRSFTARTQGRHHNAVLDASHLPDETTFNDLQLRMVCTVCDDRGADVCTAWHEPYRSLQSKKPRGWSPGQGRIMPIMHRQGDCDMLLDRRRSVVSPRLHFDRARRYGK